MYPVFSYFFNIFIVLLPIYCWLDYREWKKDDINYIIREKYNWILNIVQNVVGAFIFATLSILVKYY